MAFITAKTAKGARKIKAKKAQVTPKPPSRKEMLKFGDKINKRNLDTYGAMRAGSKGAFNTIERTLRKGVRSLLNHK
jgi:hypothetical protein